ncbi:MAG: hypothetical protein ACD_68C00114G0001, partial [uncultured bacterium]
RTKILQIVILILSLAAITGIAFFPINDSNLWNKLSAVIPGRNQSLKNIAVNSTGDFKSGDYNAIGAGFVYNHNIEKITRGGNANPAWTNCDIVDGERAANGSVKIKSGKTKAYITCEVFNGGEQKIWIGLRSQVNLPTGSEIKVKFRSSDASFNKNDLNPTWQEYRMPTDAKVMYDYHRYAQFKIELSRRSQTAASSQISQSILGSVTVNCTSPTACVKSHGPILSTNWDASQMKVFIRAYFEYQQDSQTRQTKAPIKIKYKKQSEQTWAETTTEFTDGGDNTKVISIPVDPETKYDYKISINDNDQTASYSFLSLPRDDSGEFVLFHASDSHGLNQTWPQTIKDYYQQNYADLPAAVVYTGDLFVLSDSADLNAIRTKYKTVYSTASFADLFSQIPLYQMWDDHDFYSNNSNRDYAILTTIDRNVALQARNEYLPAPGREWRENNNDDSAGYLVKIGNIPVIIADERSQKTPEIIPNGSNCANFLDGSQTDINQATIFGEEQRAWIKEAITEYKDTGLKIFVSPQSLIDNVELSLDPCDQVASVRDSLGLFYKAERNNLIQYILDNNAQNGLVVWSGDDHGAKITKRNVWWQPYPVFGSQMPSPDANLFSPHSSPEITEFKAGNGQPVSFIFDNQTYKPYWWSGCSCAYDNTQIPESDSMNADIGFAWRINYNGNSVSANVKGLLLEAEPKQCDPTWQAENCYTGGQTCTTCRSAGTELMQMNFP